MSRVAIALGSNLGDRMSFLRQAHNALARIVEIQAVSSVYETDPVGGPEQGPYLNAVIVGTTTIAPQDLLAQCHIIEAELGRERTQQWGARTVDIDLLAYDDLTSSDVAVNTTAQLPHLELPHPRAAQRAFVLVPWADVEPERDIVGHGTVAENLVRVGYEGVRHFATAALISGSAT